MHKDNQVQFLAFNKLFNQLLLLSVLLLMLGLQSIHAETWIESNANINFKPITFKVDVPGGVNYVKWLNAPTNLADMYNLSTLDGVTYQLNGFAAYRAILDDNITTLQFLIVSNAGITSTLDVPVNLTADLPPQVNFVDTTALTLYKGQQTKLPLQLTDVGRNITRIEAIIVAVGNAPDQSPIEIGSLWEEDYFGDSSANEFDLESNEPTGRVNADSLNFNLSISINQYRTTGNYDLYLRVTDSKENVSHSNPRPLTIEGPLIPPNLTIQVPNYRIPAGQPYPIHYQASHLDYLDRIEVSQTSATASPYTSTVTLNSNVLSANGIAYAEIPVTASVNDIYNLSVTVYDTSGKSTTSLATVTVGDWGERNVSVTNTAITNVDESLNFANVTVTAGSALRHLDSNIKFNSLTIDTGASFESQVTNLDINGALLVNGDLYAATLYNSATTYKAYTGARHGGNQGTSPAYGSFREPQFPGSQGSSGVHYYPVDLNITASDITVNGSIRGDGFTNNSAPGGLVTLQSNTLALNGTISANANLYAAGGTVNINTTSLTGTGVISANGGDNTTSGAGGRIAIHYDTYGDNTVPLYQGLTLSSYPGNDTSGTNDAGAGTIFLKRANQLYGELYIDNGGRSGGNTTLRSIGRHTIQSISLEPGSSDQYRVTVAGFPWILPPVTDWDLGFKGLSVSLNANNSTAPIFPVTKLVVPSGGVNIEETRTLAPANTSGSVQFHNITVTESQVVKFTLTPSNLTPTYFRPQVLIFNDTGAITAADLRANYVGSYAPTATTIQVNLPAGDYVVAVARYYTTPDAAVTGISSNACTNCGYTLRAHQANSNSFLIQSNTDITSNIGNDLIGVIRLDHFAPGTGTKVLANDRVHSTIFDVVDSASIAGIKELYSETVNNLTDPVFTGENRVYIGDVNATNLTLDASTLKIHGALNVTGNLVVQDSVTTPLDISGSGTFAAANTAGSVIYQNFSVLSDINVKISALSVDSTLSWYLFRDDGVLDYSDDIDFEHGTQVNVSIEGINYLPAGNYILAIGRYHTNETEAINGTNNIGGGTYSFKIQGLDEYGSEIDATGLSTTGSIILNDAALTLAIPEMINISGNLDLTSVTNPSVLTVPYADSTLQQVYPLILDVQGNVTVDANSKIDLSGKGYPPSTTVGFQSRSQSSSFAGEGGVRYSYNASDSVYGDFINPQFPGTGANSGGGGALTLTANSILLNGQINADGGIYYGNNIEGGTGGSIFVNTPSLAGSGLMTASAADNPSVTTTDNSSSGGRISVVAQVDTFTANGQYRSYAGPTSGVELHKQGAAGTLYIRGNTNQPGNLVIDNTRNAAAQLTDRRTMLRSIGHHTITNVESLANNDWRITVSGNPWTAPVDSRDGLGIVGLTVDMDASDEAGTPYTVTDNTSNTITVNTLDDLSVHLNASLIGVLELNQLTVTGGSQLYTEDRLVMATPAGSIISSDSKITVGQMNDATLSYFLTAPDVGTIEFVAPVDVADLTVNAGNYIFSGGLSVTNSLTVGTNAVVEMDTITTNTVTVNGGSLTALSMNVTDIAMNGGILITETVNAGGNVSLINTSTITIPYATDEKLSTLDMNVSGQLSIELGSFIDLDGKGFTRAYQSNTNFNYLETWGYYPYGCHGGRSIREYDNALDPTSIGYNGEYVLCSYGHYKSAQYAGSPNFKDEPGGGYGRIVTNDLVLNGTIRANAKTPPNPDVNYYYNQEGAAGGGLHIETATISGNGSLEARGGEDTYSTHFGYFLTGAGGRISLHHSGANSFNGIVDAGTGNPETGGGIAGAGTVYINDLAQGQDHLIIDNFNRLDVIATPNYQDVPTAIRGVGRHPISAVDSLGAGLWRVHAGNSKFDNLAEGGTLSTPQSVTYHNFTINTDQRVLFGLSDIGYNHSITVYRDDGVLDTSDYVIYIVNSPSSTNLPAGNYIAAIASGGATRDETIAGDNVDNLIHVANDGISQDSTGAITYTLNIDPVNFTTWNTKAERNITGLSVSLDAANTASAVYPIISNTAESFVIDTGSTTLDLSGVVGNDLIGVHVLDTLNVRGKSVLDLGKDRLTLLQPLASSIEAGSTLIVGQIDTATFETLLTTGTGKMTINSDMSLNSMTLSNQEIVINGHLALVGNLTVGAGSSLTTNSLTANNLLIDAGSMVSSNIDLANLDILNGGLLSVADAVLDTNDATKNKIHELVLNVTGAINIDSLSSAINLDGKGYPRNFNGPDYSPAVNPENGCSGGISHNAGTLDCTYGRYEKARFAGSGSASNGDFGGGVATIIANSLNNDGLISANGIGTGNGGAGGGIHIEVDSFTGAGSISVNSPRRGSGGRVSVYVATTDTYSASGTYSASSSSYSTTTGGAGTIFVRSPNYSAGYLRVDNNNNLSNANSTPVRSVGRHTITDATRVDASHVEITVAGNPGWKASDPALDWGLDGLVVDLDASDQSGTLYPITTNTTTTITIDDSAATIADLTVLTNQELIGVHSFERLTVTNGASIDFGSDRVVINNVLANDFLNANHIRAGEINPAALNTIFNQLGASTTLELLGDIIATALNLTSGNVITQGDVTLSSGLTLSDSANMIAYGKLDVTGNISVGANATLTTYDATATDVLIDGGTLAASNLIATNNVTVLSTAATGVLTVPSATFNPNTIYSLDVTAGNTIQVGSGAFIDVSGMGYPARARINNFTFNHIGGPDFNFRNNLGCHGGRISSVPATWLNCFTYGRLEEARFAGSSGQYYTDTQNGNGGGIIRLTAQNLNNAGSVNANGNTGYYGGAGGSIHIKVTSNLESSGEINASGGGVPYNSTSFRAGGGGRISFDLPDLLANGIDMSKVSALGGASLYSNSGAGTIFLKYTNDVNEKFGHMTIDNGGVTAETFSTPIREVGHHVITSVTAAGTNSSGEALYELAIASPDAVHSREPGVISETLTSGDTVVHHSFTLNSSRTVDISVHESEFRTHIYLFRDNNGTLTYLTNNSSSGGGYLSRIDNYSLTAGNYVVAVSGYSSNTTSTMINRLKQSNTEFGAYTLTVDTFYDVPGDTWHATDAVYGWGLDGLAVILDPAAPTLDPLKIDSNTEYSITVVSPSVDLTTSVTVGVTELMGVHEFETINITGGAQVDFGLDRVIVSRPLESAIDASSTVTADPASVLP